MTRLSRQSDPFRTSSRLGQVRAVLLVLLLLGLGGCSSTRLLYQNLDWLAFEALDDRFEIRADQEDWVWAGLRGLHSRHRETQLPAYRLTLDELAVRYSDGLDAEDLGWLDERLERHRRALVELVIPELALFLADLDEGQLAHFTEMSREAIDEAAEPLEWDSSKREAHRLDNFLDRVESWTGDLSAVQLRALEYDVAALPDIRGAWIAQRRERLRAFTELLSTHPGPDAIEAALHGWWCDLQAGYPPAYAVQRRALKERIFGLLVRLDAQLTAGQRSQVSDRLAAYISDIDGVVASR